MPTSVTGAFVDFIRSAVNLDPSVTSTARASRNWLLEQLNGIPAGRADFPTLYPEVHLHFGSFARRTKIRELDDLDMIVGISARGTTYADTRDRIELTVPEGIPLREYCHDGTNLLNSRKVINLFVSALRDIPQYGKADIKRNGAAAVLDLTSYTWSFDIVPAFFTVPEFDGRQYYLIPDGQGHWMKTDPRIDHARVQVINSANGGNVLNLIRVMKYWNKRAPIKTIPAYLLECLVLQYCEAGAGNISTYVDIELPYVFRHIASAVLGPVSDPKRIQGDLNSLPWLDRLTISARATEDERRAIAARQLESAGQPRDSIRKWREVFGDSFPSFG